MPAKRPFKLWISAVIEIVSSSARPALARLNTLPAHRYSETQTAPNGLRYRDWICTFANTQAVEKHRLDSHILDITSYHQALAPWRRDSTGATEMVLARSSLPLEQRVMHDRSPPDVPRFTAFVRSAKARLLQDIKLLPVRDQPSPGIDRQNLTLYEDEPSGQILLVYAPNGSKQLEFVSLTLLKAT